jgi:hypothetical protein
VLGVRRKADPHSGMTTRKAKATAKKELVLGFGLEEGGEVAVVGF